MIKNTLLTLLVTVVLSGVVLLFVKTGSEMRLKEQSVIKVLKDEAVYERYKDAPVATLNSELYRMFPEIRSGQLPNTPCGQLDTWFKSEDESLYDSRLESKGGM